MGRLFRMDRIILVVTYIFLSVVLCTYVENDGKGSAVSSESYRKLLAASPHRGAECYSCTDCETVTNTTPVKVCPYDSNKEKMNTCLTYIEVYKYLDKSWYIRGCASERGNCEEIKEAHSGGDLVKMKSCVQCVGDRCNNGVTRSLPNIIVAFFAIIATPLLAKSVLL